MTIYFFGDSYVEAERAESLNVKDHKRWYDILSELMDENHENFGKCGTGPINTTKEFQTRFESGWFESDDKFVIVLSSPYRIPWQWEFENKEDVAPSTIFQDFFSENKGELSFNEYHNFTLDSFYDCMYDELSYTNIKNICLLKHMSIQNLWPMIVFTVFDIDHNPKQNKYKESMYDLEYLNSNLFYFYPTPLFTHSAREWKYGNMNQGMLNHFSERNHRILANIACNHFTGSNYPVKFHEKFIIKDINRDARFLNEISPRDARFLDDTNDFVDFIYE